MVLRWWYWWCVCGERAISKVRIFFERAHEIIRAVSGCISTENYHPARQRYAQMQQNRKKIGNNSGVSTTDFFSRQNSTGSIPLGRETRLRLRAGIVNTPPRAWAHDANLSSAEMRCFFCWSPVTPYTLLPCKYRYFTIFNTLFSVGIRTPLTAGGAQEGVHPAAAGGD